MRVALFVTCLIDTLHPEVGVATVRLLRRLGCEVTFPREQTCCGQPAHNCGYATEARAVAEHWLSTFRDCEAVVCPSGSCTGMIRHSYGELFAGNDSALRDWRALEARTFELSQFLVHQLGVRDVGASFPHRVTYHPSCHGMRLCGVRDEPLELLRHVRGLELTPLERAEDCCGFGGMFAVKQDEISAAVAAEKCDHVERTAAPYLVGTDVGCLMNIAGMLRRRRIAVGALHLAQVLDSVATEGRANVGA